MGKLLIERRQKNRFAVVKDKFNSKTAYKFIAHFLPYIIMSNR